RGRRKDFSLRLSDETCSLRFGNLRRSVCLGCCSVLPIVEEEKVRGNKCRQRRAQQCANCKHYPVASRKLLRHSEEDNAEGKRCRSEDSEDPTPLATNALTLAISLDVDFPPDASCSSIRYGAL